MTNTLSSRRISSAIASRSASRTVSLTVFSKYLSSSLAGGAAFWPGGGATGRVGFASSSPFTFWRATVCGVSSETSGVSSLEVSSPSPTSKAIGVLTATPSVPSAIRILPSLPSSTASTSMVALSVSISARISPDLTSSPSCLTHLASLPSVMVGDNAGIRISIGIPVPPAPIPSRGLLRAAEGEAGLYRLALPDGLKLMLRSGFDQDVGPKLCGIGFRALRREFRGFGHDVLDVPVDRLQRILVSRAVFQDQLLEVVDRVHLRPHFGDFFLGAVLGRVGHGMAAVAVGLHLKNAGAAPFAGMGDRLFRGFLDGQHVHAVDHMSGN